MNMKIRKLLLWTLGIIAGWCLMGCGPSAEEYAAMQQATKDSIAAVNAAIAAEGTVAATNTDATPAHTYSAMDFGLPTGIVVRWVPREIPNDVESDSNFPEVFIHIKGSDGVVKVVRANWNIWQNLVTGDTLK